MRILGVLVAWVVLVSGCPKEGAPGDAALANAVARRPEPLSSSTGLAKRPAAGKNCPDVEAALRASNAPAAGQGVNGADAFTAEDLAFLEQARNCDPGDGCLAVDEPCNAGFAVNGRDAQRFVDTLRGKFKCAQRPCTAWGFAKGAAACLAGRCVFVDPEADAVAASLGAAAPAPCPDKSADRERARKSREVAGMAGIRGGATLTASDVLVLKNSSACSEGEACVHVDDPCNCGFTVNQNHEAAVRQVARQLRCLKQACCRWTGAPVCRGGECQDTW